LITGPLDPPKLRRSFAPRARKGRFDEVGEPCFLRCCMADGGLLAPRNHLAGGGFKPPRAAPGWIPGVVSDEEKACHERVRREPGRRVHTLRC
jgi:hypothetical protein